MADLASDVDVEKRLGRGLTSEEAPRVVGLLEEISVLAVDEVPQLADTASLPADAQLKVRVVVSRLVADCLSGRTDGVIAETVGPFARRYASARPRLTDDAIARLRRAAGLDTSTMRNVEGWD